MRAGLGALLDHDDGKIAVDLLEADRGGEPRRPRPNNHHVVIHRFARRQFVNLQAHDFSLLAAYGRPFRRLSIV